jgi:hypothetical protein
MIEAKQACVVRFDVTQINMSSRILLLCAAILALAIPRTTGAAVIISEFLAENDGGLLDQDGDTPDWIELQNISLTAVNLAGWHLTDTPTNLAKWTFPAVEVPSGGFLIVFASEKNRTGAELHTNFRLENSGGFLALVEPDGSTIATAFTNYPTQHRNVSYGSGFSNSVPVTLLTGNAPASWFVPTNDVLGTSWTATNFDASTWTSNNTPLRYDVTLEAGAMKIDVNQRANNTPDNTQLGFQPFTMGNASGAQSTPTTRSYGTTNVTVSSVPSGINYDDRFRGAPLNNGPLTTEDIYHDFIFSAYNAALTNGLDILIAGLSAGQAFQVTVWCFDSGSTGNRISDWYANGVLVSNNYTFNGSVLPIDDNANKIVFDATANPSGQILISARRDTASVASQPAVFLNAFQLIPLPQMRSTNGNVAALAGQNSGLYARQSFTVADPSAFNRLILRMRSDDGFVAYLNGTEIARRRAPAISTWDSTATTSNSAAVFENVELPGAASLLVTGTNVLAVHGLNITTGDDDFFIEPQLIASFATSTPGGYLAQPSPGTPNFAGFVDIVADTKFSVDRGFFDAPFSLSITCATAGANIYFTTNGSVPSPTNGFLFTAPISITGNSFIRAQAHLAGWIPSGIDTHSYIFLSDVLRQSNNIPGYPTTWQASYPADYAMDSNIVTHSVYGATISNDLRSIPSLMIVSDHNGLWNSTSGIYPNSTSLGDAWDRAGSIELIDGNGDTEFAITAKIAMHGNASRDNVRTPKHSMHASFNSDYGPTKLKYDWFGGGVDVHDGIVFRSCGFVDGWSGRYADTNLYASAETGETFRGLRYRPENTCYLRDVWVKDSFRAMGWLSSRSAFVHLYINGLYWGLYEPSERINASYFNQHVGGSEIAWDVVVGEDNNGPPVLVDGSLTDWNNLLALANAGVTTESQYQAITSLIDIDNLIDYMMLHIFAESEDWPRHNWYVAHRKATNEVPGTKFICTVWDQELTLDRLVRDSTRNRVNTGGGAGEIYSPARVYQQLRNWPEFRVRFGDRVHKHLFNNGALMPSNNVARLLAPAALIHDALVGESARWGDARKNPVPATTPPQVGTGVTFTRDEWWQPEIDKLATNFFLRITEDNINRFRTNNLYPAVAAPEFNQFGGNVSNGFQLVMSHTNLTGIIYFTTDGTDPREYGSGAVAATAQAYSTPIPINTPTVIRARVLDGANWSALVEALFNPAQDLSRLALTEIMYNPPNVGATNGDEFEFIELKNTGTNTLNLLGLAFEGISFTWNVTTLLAPGEFLVLVRNAAAFTNKYPGVIVAGQYSGSLNNGGERLALAHTFGGNIFSVNYDDVAPWPVAPDGYGFSLVQVNDNTQAPDNGARWRASTFPGGSPGADDPTPSIAPILVNELLSNPAGYQVDTVELFNPTTNDVDIGGWFLTDDPNVPKKYRITNGTVIAANSYALFDEVTHFNTTPGSNNSFGFSSAGEQVYLFSGDANTNLTGYSHGFSFGAAEAGVPFARYVNSVGEEQFPAEREISLFHVNSGPRIGKLVITEIHYNPVLGDDEFVELKNITAGPLSLFDPVYTTNAWKVNGVGFTFPTNVTIPSQALLLVVSTDPSAFRAKYSVPSNVMVFGPYSGSLANDGERIEVTKPDFLNSNNPPYIAEDSIRYNDKAPWPPAADGSGASLQRKLPHHYGDDPINWAAAAPTPGRELDSDGDGVPDFWEIANGTDPNAADGDADPDGDGFNNRQEYFAGTNPFSAQSTVRVDEILNTGTNVLLRFTVPSNRVYRVLFKDMLDAPAWSLLQEVDERAQTRSTIVGDVTTNSTRFYKLSVE